MAEEAQSRFLFSCFLQGNSNGLRKDTKRGFLFVSIASGKLVGRRVPRRRRKEQTEMRKLMLTAAVVLGIIVWEAGADWRGKKGDVKAVVTATVEVPKGTPKKVQLWAGGPYWADRNIGADAPWDYGLYFWWGDTTGHRPGYNFSPDNSAIYTYGKSVSELQSAGWVTSSGVLAPSHDAAHVKWGGAWRMPTDAEFSALINNCDWTWTTQSGVNGYVVRGRGAYASNSIFLPAAGYGFGTSLGDAGSGGDYWSSVPDSDGSYAWYLDFDSGGHSTHEYGYRGSGQSVRPVQGLAK